MGALSPFTYPVQPFNLRGLYMVSTMETHTARAERLITAVAPLRMGFAHVHSTVRALRRRMVATKLAPIMTEIDRLWPSK